MSGAAAIPRSKMDTTHTSNALKCVQTSSATSTQTSTVFEAGSKSLSRTTTKKINPLGLDAFDTDAAALQIQMRHGSIDLQHLSHLLAKCKCARHLFDFTDDAHHNIYTPLDPSSPHLGPFIAAAIIETQIDVNDRGI